MGLCIQVGTALHAHGAGTPVQARRCLQHACYCSAACATYERSFTACPHVFPPTHAKKDGDSMTLEWGVISTTNGKLTYTPWKKDATKPSFTFMVRLVPTG